MHPATRPTQRGQGTKPVTILKPAGSAAGRAAVFIPVTANLAFSLSALLTMFRDTDYFLPPFSPVYFLFFGVEFLVSLMQAAAGFEQCRPLGTKLGAVMQATAPAIPSRREGSVAAAPPFDLVIRVPPHKTTSF